MKFYLFVLGCQMNLNDSERLRFLLTNLGLKETDDQKEADVILVVACSVRQKPIDRIWGKLKVWRLATNNQYLVLTGCVVESDRKKFLEKFDFVFNVQEPQKLVAFLKKKNLIAKNSAKIESFFALNSMRQTRERAYIAIGNGCNNFCTYCVVPYTRGREIYRSVKEILTEVKLALKNGARRAEPSQHPLGGAKIISLIAQNVNSYKDPSFVILNESEESRTHARTDIRRRLPRRPLAGGLPRNDNLKNDFVDLLEKINALSGDFKIEFLTSHPKDMSDELIQAVAKLDKVIKWIHLPVQAGSNEILEKMNRKYTREHYLNLIKKIRAVIPKVFLTTDIIVGFPSESKKDFAETVSLVKICQFDQAFISPYSPRFGTVAFKMEDNVLTLEKKRRFQILDKLINKVS
jgi:tRNA-2-methylthio-N6-dimethylallyladenosine synthase